MDYHRVDPAFCDDDNDDFAGLPSLGYRRARSGSYTLGQDGMQKRQQAVSAADRYGWQHRQHDISDASMAMHYLTRVLIETTPPYDVMVSSYSSDDSIPDSRGALNDPYKVTLHFVTNPGQSIKLRKRIEPIITCFDPSFKLFNIAERSRSSGLEPDTLDISHSEYPALAVVIFFLQDAEVQDDEVDENENGTENKVYRAREYLSKLPWKRHHFDSVSGNVTVCGQNSQDFYTTENDTPVWAVRQVHYGKEHLRLMIYSTHANWKSMVHFYSLLLGRKVEYERSDFCYFVLYEKEHMNIQFALKKVPYGCKPRALNSAFLQIKVREIGELVPLLPNFSSPISRQRWQTNDPDGNVTLLLVNRKQLSANDDLQRKPRLLMRQQSTVALQSVIAPRLSPRLQFLPVISDDDEEVRQ